MSLGGINLPPYLSTRDEGLRLSGDTTMSNTTKIALAAAIVLATAVAASAATKPHRANEGQPAVRNTDPGIISDRCLPVGPPCRTHPDGW
jgi:hypothetical protein